MIYSTEPQVRHEIRLRTLRSYFTSFSTSEISTLESKGLSTVLNNPRVCSANWCREVPAGWFCAQALKLETSEGSAVILVCLSHSSNSSRFIGSFCFTKERYRSPTFTTAQFYFPLTTASAVSSATRRLVTLRLGERFAFRLRSDHIANPRNI